MQPKLKRRSNAGGLKRCHGSREDVAVNDLQSKGPLPQNLKESWTDAIFCLIVLLMQKSSRLPSLGLDLDFRCWQIAD